MPDLLVAFPASIQCVTKTKSGKTLPKRGGGHPLPGTTAKGGRTSNLLLVIKQLLLYFLSSLPFREVILGYMRRAWHAEYMMNPNSAFFFIYGSINT